MDKSSLGHHISQQFNAELEDIRNRVLLMGGLVEKQIGDAVNSLVNADVELAQSVMTNDYRVNGMEVRPYSGSAPARGQRPASDRGGHQDHHRPGAHRRPG